MIYNYTKENVGDKLTQDIHDSNIVISLKSITQSGDQLSIEFFASISAGEKAILDGLVASHNGENLLEVLPPQIIESMDKIESGGASKCDIGTSFTATAGQVTTYDFNITRDIYVKGGVLYTEGNHILDNVTLTIKFGANPIYSYLENFPVDKFGKTELEHYRKSDTNMNGLIIEVKYDSKGSVDVPVNLGIRGYES